ncbi:MAG: hypothetical protein HY752_04475 [Nitrospirae bacterium]|nr:hypothetical protein [Nitrospirota bacterium]
MIRFSPQAKISLYILLIIISFIFHSFKFKLALLGLVVVFAFHVPISTLKRGFLPIILFLTFTFLSNIFFHTGNVIYEAFGFTITEEGIKNGGQLTLRLFILIMGAKVLTATTTAGELVNGMNRLLGPLGRLNIIKEVMATMSLTVRFLPIIYDEAYTLYKDTMKNYQGGTFADRVRLSVSLITPLFERSMKRAKNLLDEYNA